MPRRCELGCSHNPGVTHHQFPHPEKNPEVFKAWVNIVGGKLETADDIKFYRKRVICDIHFANQFKNRNNRLNTLAVPTLHLHGFPTQAAHMPVISTELPTPEHIWNLPSTSKQITTEKLKSTSSLENQLKISRFQMKNMKTEINRLRKRSRKDNVRCP